MGNNESMPDETHDDFLHQPPSYANNLPPSFSNNHPPSYAGSSTDPNYQRKQQASYIADNFNSVDEVLIIPSLFINY